MLEAVSPEKKEEASLCLCPALEALRFLLRVVGCHLRNLF